MIKEIDLRTARLRIRHFSEADLDNCIQFRRQVFGFEEDGTAAAGWLKWTVDSYRELAQLGQPPYADYAVELAGTGAFIGSAGIVPTVAPWGALKGDGPDDLLSPEVGLFWGIMPEYRRRGYASEAGQALIDFLFDELRIRQVVATTEYDNIASQRTMQKLGMRLYRNPGPEPAWLQIVGLLENPRADTDANYRATHSVAPTA